PSLIGRERVVEGNSRLAASASVAELAGFASAGALFQFAGAAVTMVADAATFVVSAATLVAIRRPEPRPKRSGDASAIDEAKEGWNVVRTNPTLRALVGCSTTMRLAGGAYGAMYVLFAVRDLHLPPAAVGVIAGC